MRESDMPFTEEGMRPTFLFNPHGLPSRMTCAQLLESMLGNLCAMKGVHHDGTIFKDVDIESIAEELEQHGLHRYGYKRMLSGMTGEYIDTLVFFGPTYYQRLQKFVADAEYSVRNALTDAITFGWDVRLIKVNLSLRIAGDIVKLREPPLIYLS